MRDLLEAQPDIWVVGEADTASAAAANMIPSVSQYAGQQLLTGLVNTVFKGETLRSMLLNAYGWWKVSQITYIASLISFGLGGLALIASVLGLAGGRRRETPVQAAPRAEQEGPAPVKVA